MAEQNIWFILILLWKYSLLYDIIVYIRKENNNNGQNVAEEMRGSKMNEEFSNYDLQLILKCIDVALDNNKELFDNEETKNINKLYDDIFNREKR